MALPPRPLAEVVPEQLVTIDSTMLEFVRHERLAWDAHCKGRMGIMRGRSRRGMAGVCAHRGDAERVAGEDWGAVDAGQEGKWALKVAMFFRCRKMAERAKSVENTF